MEPTNVVTRIDSLLSRKRGAPAASDIVSRIDSLLGIREPQRFDSTDRAAALPEPVFDEPEIEELLTRERNFRMPFTGPDPHREPTESEGGMFDRPEGEFRSSFLNALIFGPNARNLDRPTDNLPFGRTVTKGSLRLLADAFELLGQLDQTMRPYVPAEKIWLLDISDAIQSSSDEITLSMRGAGSREKQKEVHDRVKEEAGFIERIFTGKFMEGLPFVQELIGQERIRRRTSILTEIDADIQGMVESFQESPGDFATFALEDAAQSAPSLAALGVASVYGGSGAMFIAATILETSGNLSDSAHDAAGNRVEVDFEQKLIDLALGTGQGSLEFLGARKIFKGIDEISDALKLTGRRKLRFYEKAGIILKESLESGTTEDATEVLQTGLSNLAQKLGGSDVDRNIAQGMVQSGLSGFLVGVTFAGAGGTIQASRQEETGDLFNALPQPRNERDVAEAAQEGADQAAEAVEAIEGVGEEVGQAVQPEVVDEGLQPGAEAASTGQESQAEDESVRRVDDADNAELDDSFDFGANVEEEFEFNEEDFSEEFFELDERDRIDVFNDMSGMNGPQAAFDAITDYGTLIDVARAWQDRISFQTEAADGSFDGAMLDMIEGGQFVSTEDFEAWYGSTPSSQSSMTFLRTKAKGGIALDEFAIRMHLDESVKDIDTGHIEDEIVAFIARFNSLKEVRESLGNPDGLEKRFEELTGLNLTDKRVQKVIEDDFRKREQDGKIEENVDEKNERSTGQRTGEANITNKGRGKKKARKPKKKPGKRELNKKIKELETELVEATADAKLGLRRAVDTGNKVLISKARKRLDNEQNKIERRLDKVKREREKLESGFKDQVAFPNLNPEGTAMRLARENLDQQIPIAINTIRKALPDLNNRHEKELVDFYLENDFVSPQQMVGRIQKLAEFGKFPAKLNLGRKLSKGIQEKSADNRIEGLEFELSLLKKKANEAIRKAHDSDASSSVKAKVRKDAEESVRVVQQRIINLKQSAQKAKVADKSQTSLVDKAVEKRTREGRSTKKVEVVQKSDELKLLDDIIALQEKKIIDAEQRTDDDAQEVVGSAKRILQDLKEQREELLAADKKIADDLSVESAEDGLFPQDPFQAGIKVGFGPKVKKDNLVFPEEAKADDPDVEVAFQTAEKGIQSRSYRERVKAALENLRTFRRPHFARRLDRKVYAVLTDILRVQHNLKSYADIRSHGIVREIVRNLGSNEYKIFTRFLALRDLQRDHESGSYDEGKKLPFKIKDKEQIDLLVRKYGAIVSANKAISDAVRRRNVFVKKLSVDLVSAKLLPPEAVDNADRYYHRQVMDYFNEKDNLLGNSGAGLRNSKKGFQKRRVGGGDFNLRYHEAETEWISQAIVLLQTQTTQNEIHRMYDITPELKGIMKESGTENIADVIPDGYVEWSPEVGTHFFNAMMVPEKVLARALESNENIDPAELRKVLVRAKRKSVWIIPLEVAQTLNEFKAPRTDNDLERAARTLTNAWKQWVLISPPRVLKYNINNLSGDLDIVLAYSPKILKFTKQAASDLWKFHNKNARGKLLSELEEILRLGGIDSGFKAVEVASLTKHDNFFRVISGETGKIQPIINSTWGNSKNFTQWRENILRLAAFRYFKERLEKGDRPMDTASSAVEMRQMYEALEKGDRTIDEVAARLGRELVGDYGNVSFAGQYIREHLIPFWAWHEINAPRYIRLFKNAVNEDQKKAVVKAAGKSIVRRAITSIPGLLFKSNLLLMMFTLFNKAAHPDEEEELRRTDRARQLHLILGRDNEGNIRTLRTQGALSDALESVFLPVGGSDYPSDIADIMAGRETVMTKLIDGPVSVVDKLINSAVPIEKTAFELVTGVKTYPRLVDVFTDQNGGTKIRWKPSGIRDRGEHAAKLFSLDWLYREVTGKPNFSASNWLEGWVTYRTNPEEAAYYHTRSLMYTYLKKHGDSGVRIGFTESSNNLYYYRRALTYGQDKRAEKFLQKYYDLGGTKKGLKASLRSQHPLNSFSTKPDNRTKLNNFLDSVSQEELQVIDQGMNYYVNLFLKGKPDSKTLIVRRKIRERTK